MKAPPFFFFLKKELNVNSMRVAIAKVFSLPLQLYSAVISLRDLHLL